MGSSPGCARTECLPNGKECGAGNSHPFFAGACGGMRRGRSLSARFDVERPSQRLRPEDCDVARRYRATSAQSIRPEPIGPYPGRDDAKDESVEIGAVRLDAEFVGTDVGRSEVQRRAGVYLASREFSKRANSEAGPGYASTHPACRSELSMNPPQRTQMVVICAFLAAAAS